MTDKKLPARLNLSVPGMLSEVMGTDMMPAGDQWFGPQHSVIGRRTRVVERSTDYNLARARQADSVCAAIDARIRLARKYGEVLDLHNLLSADQHEREHARGLAENRRMIATLDAAHELRMTVLRHELDVAKVREQSVRADRNLEAARRVADVQIDSWYQQASAARNESWAVRQDTDADLKRSQPVASPDALKAAAADELAKAMATIENEIELARQRGNAAAVLALQNIKARLKSAA